MKNVYTIPAGVPFAKALATQLLAETGGDVTALSHWRILLPTRRACRTLREAFLQLNNGKPLLLPNMQPIGDLDEDELSFNFLAKNTVFDLPPAITPLKRQLLLARIVQSIPGYAQGPEQAIGLARALGELLDQIIIEERDISRLQEIVPEDFAHHWQITIDFLQILSQHWPRILAENGEIDSADRRNRLIRALGKHWLEYPPEANIIAAGSTGSIPATAELLSVIAGLPGGRIVLPGLDQTMDEESWQALDESHPQYGLKHLLSYMKTERASVTLWPGCKTTECRSRHLLATELMRPAATSGQWQTLGTSSHRSEIEKSLAGLRIFDCDNQAEEATVIALLLRETLQDKTRTAALVTPNKKLAQRVAALCRRWDITLDNSAGQPLAQTRVGAFLRLSINANTSGFAPAAFLALLRHDFCRLNLEYDTLRKTVDKLEVMTLRGTRPAPGLDGIKERLQDVNDRSLINFLDRIEPATKRFSHLALNSEPQKFSEFLFSHIEMMEALAESPGEGRMNHLWIGDDGEAAASFLTDLQRHAHLLPDVSGQNYEKIFNHLMKDITVRPRWGTHPRLSILGQLEARLVDADLMILSSLNEGSWPPDPGHDPWMSRPMRNSFGLPPAERAVGLAAHDFIQGFCAPLVVLTRAKQGEGTPTVPSRWLQRLDTVLQAANISPEMLRNHDPSHWARMLDAPDNVFPYTRPAPCPPTAKRPAQLSVTRIETWLQDPYSIYARHILKLRKLDPLDAPQEAKERGDLLHKILQHFVAEYPLMLPPDAEKQLIRIARAEVIKLHDNPAAWHFWWPRFYNLSRWLIAHEKSWRRHVVEIHPEVKGKMQINAHGKLFTLTARADRIDRLSGGKLAIIDYKSGGTYTKSAIRTGKSPQLSLEAAILLEGGFEAIQASEIDSLAYWKLTGAACPGEITKVDDNISDIVAGSRKGLVNLITVFENPDTPYYALPASDNLPRFNDYRHLERVKEWAALDDSTEETV